MQISAISLNVNNSDVFFNSKVEQILPNVTTELKVDDLQKNLFFAITNNLVLK